MKDAAIGEFGKNTGAVRNACIEKRESFIIEYIIGYFILQKLDSVPKWTKKGIIKPNNRKTYIV